MTLKSDLSISIENALSSIEADTTAQLGTFRQSFQAEAKKLQHMGTTTRRLLARAWIFPLVVTSLASIILGLPLWAVAQWFTSDLQRLTTQRSAIQREIEALEARRLPTTTINGLPGLYVRVVPQTETTLREMPGLWMKVAQ